MCKDAYEKEGAKGPQGTTIDVFNDSNKKELASNQTLPNLTLNIKLPLINYK